MLIREVLCTFLAAASTVVAASINHGRQGLRLHKDTRDTANGLVTWDEHSLFVKGQRVLFYSGEFHPFRLPVPGLWLDVFQKIKALGYNGVSFYVDWSLLEGTPGRFQAQGIFALEPFFEAAQSAGIYLLARPGPYINAEAAGGGFPGWLARNPATLRTSDPGYFNATQLYMSSVGAIIAKAQITNGGPIILVQPENEYSTGSDFPEPAYFGAVEQQLRDAGIVVPLISNDAGPYGNFAPGDPDAVDIYGHDGYPLGFDCADPSAWGTNSLPTDYGTLHEEQSPSTPYAIVEFQGGSFDPWGGVGFNNCAAFLNGQFESVFYKNDFSFKVAIFNLYMTFGGSNWGNIGHPLGYSSYDYGAAIAEDRTVTREKYGEAKLLATSLRALPAYLTAVPQNNSNAAGAYTGNTNVFVSGIFSNTTKFFVARQTAYYSESSVKYLLTVPTSQGNVTIPQLGGKLSINGRDSKIHVVDCDLGGIDLLYSSAEIFTWQKYGNERVLVVYGGPGEQHEFAVVNGGAAVVVEGPKVKIQSKKKTVVVNFQVGAQRSVVRFANGLIVYITNRQSAYGYWVIDPSPSATTAGLPIVHMQSGYLVRDVQVNGRTVAVTGDLNRTSQLEVIGAPGATSLTFNGQKLSTSRDSKTGALNAVVKYKAPQVSLPNLATVGWKTIDGLPEIQNSYDDSKWPKATLTYTNNTERPDLNTPTSLYACDYGFHTGSLVYRGHFQADGTETTIQISPQGGYAFGYSLWINETFLGSYTGSPNNYYYYGTFNLPKLTSGKNYVFTVLIDHMGNNENYDPGYDYMKEPRGVMQYVLGNRNLSVISWKLTGNLGGEEYADQARGPLNEGGMWAERHGYHLPDPPTKSWANSKGPTSGISQAGVQFFSTTFNLNMPQGYDIPIGVDFGASALTNSSNYRCQIFVNGYQFGKFVSNIGPQTLYPVPQGIWNYQGSNTLAISLWALDKDGAKVPELNLVAGPAIQSGYGTVALSPQPKWTLRSNAY